MLCGNKHYYNVCTAFMFTFFTITIFTIHCKTLKQMTHAIKSVHTCIVTVLWLYESGVHETITQLKSVKYNYIYYSDNIDK